MPDDIIERLTRVETLLTNCATRADIVQLQEQMSSVCSVVNKYVIISNSRVDKLETRVRNVELDMGAIKVKFTIIAAIGLAALGGVVGLVFEALRGVIM